MGDLNNQKYTGWPVQGERKIKYKHGGKSRELDKQNDRKLALVHVIEEGRNPQIIGSNKVDNGQSLEAGEGGGC